MSRPSESAATVVCGAAGDGFEDVAGGGESGFDAGAGGVDGAGDDAADSGDEIRVIADGDDAGGGADYVDDIAQANAGADGIPVGIEGAGGDGDAGAEAELRGPFGREASGDAIGRGVDAGNLGADAGEYRVDTR